MCVFHVRRLLVQFWVCCLQNSNIGVSWIFSSLSRLFLITDMLKIPIYNSITAVYTNIFNIINRNHGNFLKKHGNKLTIYDWRSRKLKNYLFSKASYLTFSTLTNNLVVFLLLSKLQINIFPPICVKMTQSAY